jgi:tyrosine-protein phosphatase SIW14
VEIIHGIPNLFAVEQNILRGGQPNDDGWAYLKTQGVCCVIKLNTEEEGSDATAEKLGMQVFKYPIPWWRQMLWRPKQRDLLAAVALIASGTFIHCEHGEDRTGLVVGCFRLSQGLTKPDAYAEMLAFSFHPSLQGLQGRWNSEDPKDWIK